MKYYLAKSIIIAIFCFSYALNAMIYYNLMKNSKEQHVLILGEQCSIEKSKSNQTIKKFIQTILTTSLTQTVPFIVEHEPINNPRSYMNSDCVATILELEKTLNLNQKKIDIIYYEPRTSESNTIQSIIYDLTNVARDTFGANKITEYHKSYNFTNQNKKFPQNKKWLEITNKAEKYSLINTFFTLTIREYFNYLESNHNKIKKLLNKFSDNPIMTEILKESINTYQKAFENIKKDFESCNPEDNYATSFTKLYCKNLPLEDFIPHHDKLMQNSIHNTESLFAEIFFLDKVLDTHTSNSCVCIFLLNFHAEKLSEYLKKLNFTTISTQNACLLRLPFFIALDTKIVSELFKPKKLAEQFLKPIVKICPICSKKTELKRCSTCKSTWYCSVQCQRKDWDTHRISCKFCPICSKKTELKKCGTCESTWYCSVRCQGKDWPTHKIRCKKRK